MAANQVVTVREADGTTLTDVEILGTARQAAAASKSVALSTEDKAQLDALVNQGLAGPVAFALSDSIVPATTSDATKTRITAAASVNNTLVSAAARVLRSLDIYNEAAYPVYFKLYDKATAPVAGTDSPFWTIPIPANSGYSKEFIWGRPVTNGLGYAITKNKVDTDTTAVAASDLVGMLTWR